MRTLSAPLRHFSNFLGNQIEDSFVHVGMAKGRALIPLDFIETRIYLVRGLKVMLDRDLAEVYGVSTKRLNEQVRRNRRRFPDGFVFRLSTQEAKDLDSLRSQIATLKKGRGGHRKYLPHVFTEHGAVMLACVLSSSTAVAMSVHVVRAFVRLRHMAADRGGLAAQFEDLERVVQGHDEGIRNLFEAIKELRDSPEPPRRRIGFKSKKE